jgi:hypothetical protein
MIDFIKRLFGVSDKPVEAAPANITAPYKVPEPAATTPIPLVVESAPAKPKPQLVQLSQKPQQKLRPLLKQKLQQSQEQLRLSLRLNENRF